ncbi:MAG: RNA polymerase sigma factor [Gemmataceae bacterium]|nr:RNA polymerase sigma factor [Gemmataceae bacterium]
MIMSNLAGDRTSATLLQRVKDMNDQEAWQRFVDVYGPKVLGWCRHHGIRPDSAEDVTQNVLVKLIAIMRTFAYDPSRSFRGYLHKVTHNACSEYRKSRREAALASGDGKWLALIDDEATADDFIGNLVEEELHHEALERTMQEAHPRDWEAFDLKVLKGNAAEASANAMGIQVSSVYVMAGRVRKMYERWKKVLEQPADERGEVSP